jgi:hypothetical protein
MCFENLVVVVGKIRASLLVLIGRPVKFCKLDIERPKFLGDCLDDPDSRFDHFGTNTIGTDLSDFVNGFALRCGRG